MMESEDANQSIAVKRSFTEIESTPGVKKADSVEVVSLNFNYHFLYCITTIASESWLLK